MSTYCRYDAELLNMKIYFTQDQKNYLKKECKIIFDTLPKLIYDFQQQITLHVQDLPQYAKATETTKTEKCHFTIHSSALY